MNRFPLVLLLIVGAVAWGQNATPPAGDPGAPNEILQKWLTTIDAQWQPLFARDVTAPFDAETTRLQQQYLATLDANMAKATAAGNLDLALLWRKERERFVAEKDLPPTDDATDPAALQAARAAIRTQAARLEKDRVGRAKSLHDRYDQVLAQAQTQLTQRQRLDDALVVKNRRAEIAKAWLGEGGAAPTAKTENHDSAGQPAVAASSTPPPQISSAKANEQFFVDKTWVSPTGTNYAFAPDGSGYSQFGNSARNPITWHHVGSGIVEVVVVGKSKVNNRYFRFVSATEAYYNGDKNDITKPVHLK